MKEVIDKYWMLKLNECKNALEKNNFEAYVTETSEEAKRLVFDKIIPNSGAKKISHGGSLTVDTLEILDLIRKNPEFEVIEALAFPTNDRKEKMERARHALIVDLFITGTNAVTETGILVNLDMWGNRVGAMAYGPRNVLIIAGRNKLVPNLSDAMDRIKSYAAPANAIRHDMKHPRKTPCVATGKCIECNGEWRICNTWVINEKSFPKGRIIVVLINEDLGL